MNANDTTMRSVWHARRGACTPYAPKFDEALVRHFATLHCTDEALRVSGDWEGAQALTGALDVARHYLWRLR